MDKSNVNEDQHGGVERRVAPRHAIEVEASLKPSAGGEPIPVTTRNISGTGVYLRSDGPTGLAVGDEVSCDLKRPPANDDALSWWGIGRIVRVENGGTAIELSGNLHSHCGRARLGRAGRERGQQRRLMDFPSL